MERQSLVAAIKKLAIAGEQAGFSLEQMIQLLNGGISVEELLELIIWRLYPAKAFLPPAIPPSLWVM